MGNMHRYQLTEEIEATDDVKKLIKFMFYPSKAPTKELSLLQYKWFYGVSNNFKIGGKFRSEHIEIKNNKLIHFKVNATNSSFNADMMRYIEMIGLRGIISLTVEEEKIY